MYKAGTPPDEGRRTRTQHACVRLPEIMKFGASTNVLGRTKKHTTKNITGGRTKTTIWGWTLALLTF